MKTLSVTEAARNFSAVLDGVEREQEEVVLVRNRRKITRKKITWRLISAIRRPGAKSSRPA